MKLSFIIPAYNASTHIIRCLDSIYNQIYPFEYEVIVTDDCSTDDTVAVVEKYSMSVDNLILLRQSANHRQGAARNLALQHSSGDYVTFVDSDDAIADSFSFSLVNFSSMSDIIVCRKLVEDCNGKFELSQLKIEPPSTVNGTEFMKVYHDWHFIGGPVAYFFKMTFLMSVNIPFAEDVSTEDEDWINIHLYLAHSISCCPHVLYLYYYNVTSTTKNKRSIFMDVSRILCSYREFQYAEQYCKTDIECYNWFREIATLHIEVTFKHLWKTDCYNYLSMFNTINKRIRTYLLNIQSWSRLTTLMLKYPIVGSCLLSALAPSFRLLKKLNNIWKIK